MDFENNGQNVTNFMLKIKKQAKRLFQLSKKNQNDLQVESLSQAQEILAKINGYPDWHALEKNITLSKNILVKDNDMPIIYLDRYESENLYYYRNGDTVTSFLRVKSLAGNTDKIQDILQYYNEILDMKLHMGIHLISVFVEQKNNKYNKEMSYSLYEVSKSFNLSEDEAKKLFYINKSNVEIVDENNLTIYILITTSIKNKKEHMNICLNMLSGYQSIHMDSFPYLEKAQLEHFQLKNSMTNKELEKNLFESPTIVSNIKENNKILINKWIYLLNILYEKKIGFILKYSLEKKQLQYHFENYKKDKQLIDTILHSITKTDLLLEQNLHYVNKYDINYIEGNKKGLSLKSKINNRIFHYHHQSNIRTSQVDIIVAKSGSGKTTLNSMITLSSILEKDLNSIPQIGIIDVGQSYQGMIDIIKNILPIEMRHTVHQYNIENSEKYAINVFDLPFGKRVYDNEDIERILPIICSLLNRQQSLTEYIKDCLLLLNQCNHKLYQANINSIIDNILEKLAYKTDNKTTWWNIVDFLFINGFDKVAIKAQRYATPLLSDFITLLSNNGVKEKYKNIIIEKNENLIQYTTRVLIDTIRHYPHISQPTKLEIEETKIAYFNLEKVCNLEYKNMTNYWFGLILDMISYKLMAMNSYIKNYPYDWNEDWKNYITQAPLNHVYDYYRHQKIGDYWKKDRKIIIDDCHLYANNYWNNEQLTLVTRESRKNAVAISIITQSLKNLESIINFSTAIFSTNLTNEDIEILKKTGIDNIILDGMKKNKKLSWAVLITTNRGKFFDIVKLEIPPHLLFALSNINEDITIKKQIMKKMNYFQMLNKVILFLNKEKVNTIKQYIQKESQQTKKQSIDNIVKQINNNQ